MFARGYRYLVFLEVETILGTSANLNSLADCIFIYFPTGQVHAWRHDHLCLIMFVPMFFDKKPNDSL